MEKSWLDGSFTRADHRDKGGAGWGGGFSISGSAALIIYHRTCLGEEKQPTIDCAHWCKWAEGRRTPTPTAPSTPGRCSTNCSKHQAKQVHNNVSLVFMRRYHQNFSFNTLLVCYTQDKQGNSESPRLVTRMECDGRFCGLSS